MITEGKSILITGGTGTFGKQFVARLLADSKFKNITVFSRDELKQFEMKQELNDPRVNYLLGDVRDYERIYRGLEGVDLVVHAAAMKQVPASEENPMEAIKTNVLGAANIINACVEREVEKVIALSTDKAANPVNLYGATKLCSDKLFLSANNFPFSKKSTKFSVVRYGNVLGSRGSVVPFFIRQKELGFIPITHQDMTRFWITLDQGISFVRNVFDLMSGGEIFIPKIPSFRIMDVAEVIAPNVPIKFLGIRSGEKIHEVMITEDDARNTLDFGDHYRIIESPIIRDLILENDKSILKVEENFTYSSKNNSNWLSKKEFFDLLVRENLT
jgi:UDP-N-acetylglucosamine 4,6-dehydratase